MDEIDKTLIDETVAVNPVIHKSTCCAHWNPGESIGEYEIKEEIGSGGLARVYKAYDSKLDRYVAIKVLRMKNAASEGARKRFKQEISLQAKLSLPGCVRVYGAGEHDGNVYCAMEYVEGKTLQQLLHDKALDTSETIKILIRVAEIIKDLHHRGLEHRDIKPGNIMLNKYNEVVLLDFGLAKAMEEQLNICVTSHGEVFGTPAYMSPEQGGQENKLYRAGCSDVYALGVLAFEMLTGELPYAIANLTLDEVFYVIRNEKPVLVSKYNKKVPKNVEYAVDLALNKEPSSRITSEEFWEKISNGDKLRKRHNVSRNALIIAGAAIAAVIVIALLIQVSNLSRSVGNSPKEISSSPEVVSKSERKTLYFPEINMNFVKLNSGSFLMGNSQGDNSEKPVHKVKLTDSFYIAPKEVTGKQYAAITGSAPKGQARSNLPVTGISWHDANRFCRLLSIREREAGRIPEDMAFRLPTEAEWEYACRAGSEKKYYYGDETEILRKYAVFGVDQKVVPGTLAPNKFGLYDTLGNVWEWCYDTYGPYGSQKSTNPIADGQAHLGRVIRGGGAASEANECTAYRRRKVSPNRTDPFIGFRVVLSKKRFASN